ncbi:hypothetical protein D3C81_1716070 [compost metagenome]
MISNFLGLFIRARLIKYDLHIFLRMDTDDVSPLVLAGFYRGRLILLFITGDLLPFNNFLFLLQAQKTHKPVHHAHQAPSS